MTKAMTDTVIQAARETGETLRKRRWPRRIAGRKQQVNIGTGERVASALLGATAAVCGLRMLMTERSDHYDRSPARNMIGTAMAALGGALAYRGASGHSLAYRALGVEPSDATTMSHPLSRTVHVSQSVTINRSAEEIYRAWREIDNLPRIFEPIKSVRKQNGQRAHWVVSLPNGRLYEWDSRLVEDRPNELLAWASEPDAAVPNAGEIRLKAATGGRGTVVHVSLHHRPPGGALGALGAALAGQSPKRQLRENLRRFKQWMEAGELATNTGQPRGRCA